MGLDVETPPPPDLQETRDGVNASAGSDEGDVDEGDGRRADLEDYLEQGAWERGFGEWAEHTDLDETEFGVARDLGLFEEFDFFWDGFAERVGYDSPGIPEDWRERDLHPDLDSWGSVSNVNASLADLGRAVADVLEDEYVDWGGEYEAPDDLPEF